MGNVYLTQDCSKSKPTWYWIKNGGFHDAKIIAIKDKKLNYDYTKPNPVRNYFEIELKLVKTHYIRFFNYKITQGILILGNWWLCDILREENNKYILDITICDDNGKESFVSICFDYAEVLG